MKNYYDLQGDGGSGILEQVTRKVEEAARNLDTVRSIVAIGSGKGGVGKSSLTAVLGAAMAARGHRVAILDADLNGPSQARMNGLGLVPMLPGRKGLLLPKSNHGIGVVSMGALVPEGASLELGSVAQGDSHTWRATQELTLLRDLLSTVEWDHLDLLLIDLPPGAERTVQYIEALGPRVALLLVTIPADLARGVVSRSVAAVRETPNRLLGYVENMSGYVCPDCHAVKPLFPETRAVDLDLPLLGSIPFDPVLAERLDRGVPTMPGGPIGVALGDLADQLSERIASATTEVST